MSEETRDKIMYQYVMNYKAYRRHALSTRLGITVVLIGGMLGLCAINIMLGIIFAAIVACFGAISVIISFGAEQTYTVYSDRIVIKVRGNDKRKIVDIADIRSVKYSRAFYEKSLLTGTVKFTAKTAKGVKKYKLRHITNAQQTIDYINSYNTREKNENESRE